MIEGDIHERVGLDSLLASYEMGAAIDFAGLKAIGESVALPLDCNENNVCAPTCLLHAMSVAWVRQFVFSSCATVYGALQYLPPDESHSCSATNPCGRTS